MNLHIKTVHNKIKDFECKIGNKAFRRKSYLQKHLKTPLHKKIAETNKKNKENI